MLNRSYQAITRYSQVTLIFLFAFLLMAAPLLAEMSSDDYYEILVPALQKQDNEKILKLVKENPNATQQVIQLLESNAKQASGDQAKAFNDVASFLRQISDNSETKRNNTTQSSQKEFDRAATLFNDGQKLFNISDFRGAIERWESSLATFQKLGKKQAIGVALGNLGLAYIYLGDYRKAIGFCEKALAIAEEIGDKKGKGNHLGNLGLAYSNLGDYRKAIGFYEKALAIAEEIGDKKGKGTHLGNLGLAYSNLGDYRKAISFHEKALAIAEAIGDKKGKETHLGNLGLAYRNLGDYRKAISFYEKALAIAEAIGDKKGKGTDLGNLGNAYNYLGDYRKAIGFYEKALAIAEEIGDKKGKGNHLGNLGLAYRNLGDYRKAISFYEKALAIAEAIGDKKSKGADLGNLGLAYKDLGDYGKAISFYEKALAIAEEIGDKNGKGNRLGNLGSAYSDLGDYRKAISFHEKAIDVCKEIGVPYDIPEGNLADSFLALDSDDEALTIYTKQNHSIRLGRYYLKKNEYAKAKEQFDRNREEDEKAKKTQLILPKWIGLGLSNEGLKNYEEAYKWYKNTISFMEEQRAALTSAEREHYFEGKEFGFPRIEAYEGAVRSAFMLGKFDDAFYWAENTRGRIFSELLSNRHSGKGYKIPIALADEEEDLTDKIRQNKKQQQTSFEKNNPELIKQLETEYPALKTKMDNLIDRLRKEYPQYAAIKYPQPVKLSQLALKPGETIIEYEVTDPYTIGMVIREGKVVKSFKVDKTRKELEALVKIFRSPFQEGADFNSFSLNQATQLADLLIKPALSAVKKGDRLIIVPDESLSLVPFESLLLSAPAAALKEEATLLAAQTTKQTEGDTVDKASIIRGLTKTPATRGIAVIAPRVSTHILFDTGSAQVKGESGNQLKEIQAAFTSNELKKATIRIEGHTDSVGDAKFNLRLSHKRARSIYDYLTKNGIPAERLNYTGKGDTEPLASNSDEKGRKLNRRVDFVRIDTAAPGQKAAPAKGFVYAMDEYPISYYQSASVLSLQRGLKIKRATDQSFFGLGDPVFDTADNRSAGMRSLKVVAKDQPTGGSDIATNEETKDAGYQFGRLLNTEKEIKEVGKLFGNAKLLTGVDASEEKLKGEDLSSKRYLLFSTHGILGNEIPYIKQPSLVLNLVGNDKEDGFLTASEIFDMNLNADVVGLSACKTGLGVQSAGEGVVGLSRAFMYAGTDTVLVSLWSVADDSTYKLMVKFFEGVKSGKDKMTALNEAKNYLRNNGYSNPFYWAPFILMGEAN